LVCLAVAAALSVVVVKQIATERRVAQMNERSLQALWLAEAGLERAAARLAAEPKYVGETWTIPAADLAANEGGVVRIQIETVAGRPERRSVRVEADYPDAADYRCRQVKQIIVDRDYQKGTVPFSPASPRKSGQSPEPLPTKAAK
jgi:type II secretory pathway component PulK